MVRAKKTRHSILCQFCALVQLSIPQNSQINREDDPVETHAFSLFDELLANLGIQVDMRELSASANTTQS